MPQLPAPPTPPLPAMPALRAASNEPRVIYLHALAPAKPPTGTPCNGCGVCCATEPCPLGMLLSRRRRGACAALRWSPTERRYLCGALARPGEWFSWLPERLAAWLVKRWISAGVACDADLSAQ